MIGLGLRRRLASLTDRNAPMSKPDRTLAVDCRPLEALIPYARNARTDTAEQVTLVAFGKSRTLWWEARMTGSTYRNREEERDDREQQARLLAALDAAPSQLRRDECGWWIIGGRHGAIHTWGDGKSWLAYLRCRSKQHWTFTKRRLAFMTVTQDGDDEGCLRLFHLPSPQEAVVIRDVMGLRKRVAYAPDTLRPQASLDGEGRVGPGSGESIHRR